MEAFRRKFCFTLRKAATWRMFDKRTVQ